MSTLTKPFTFTGGTFAVASQVNSNLDTLYGWVNGSSAIWADASRSFTAVPSGPNSDPTSANQLTRKSYVDGRLGGNLVRMGVVNLATDGSGNAGVNFSPAFPSACNGIVGMAAGPVWVNEASRSAANAFFNCRNPNGTNFVGSVNVFYIAWGA